MKIYLAGSYADKERLRDLAADLSLQGHVITSRWLYEPDTNNEISDRLDRLETTDDDDKILSRIAGSDLDDIDACDKFILHTAPGKIRGGSATELGYAIAQDKQISICGPKTQAFHFLPQIKTICESCGWEFYGGMSICLRCRVMAEVGS